MVAALRLAVIVAHQELMHLTTTLITILTIQVVAVVAVVLHR
jgi:hypothetical protein